MKSRKRSRAAKLAWRRRRHNPFRRTRRPGRTYRRRRRRNPLPEAGWSKSVRKKGWKDPESEFIGPRPPRGRSRVTRTGRTIVRKRRSGGGKKKSASKKGKKYLTKHQKRVLAGKKAARTRKARAAARSRARGGKRKAKRYAGRRVRRGGYRRIRRGGYTYSYSRPRRKHRSRSAAAKYGWRRRRHGALRKKGRRRYRLLTSHGRKYKQTRKRRGAYHYWKNPGMIRTRNPGAMDIVVPTLVAIAGMVGAAFIISKLPANITSKVPYAPVVIPVGLGLLTVLFLTKKFPAQSKIIFGLGAGMMLAGGIALYNQFAPAGLPKIGGLSGYAYTPFSGYVRSPMSGYVRAGGALGQLEERIPRSLGASVEYRGDVVPMIPGEAERALAYSPSSVKPYGLGEPKESRRYNDFTFGGVYSKSSYEL